LRRSIVQATGADGGWPYYPGRLSRIEPTCWAVLGLSVAGGEATATGRGLSYLRRLQRADGLLAEPGVGTVNYGWNGLALLVDVAVSGPSSDPWRDRLIDALLAAKGVALPDTADIRQNNQLQAWSWIDGTFSWVEPTALCLLALKKTGRSGPAVAARVEEAEAVLFDRVCDVGGWNYGNAQVLSQNLRPYVPTTALALLALQDRCSHPAVQRSLDWLAAHATSEPAAMALSLAGLCLEAFGRPADASRALLVEQKARTGFLGSIHLTSMALVALSASDRRSTALVLS
jgi:hypothetical protein